MKVEYMEVTRADLAELNRLGARGWKPSSLLREPGNRFTCEGWTGLLFREAEEPTASAESTGEKSADRGSS